MADRNGEVARGLVQELLRTGLVLIDVLDGLLEEIPEDAYPGEDGAAVLVEMLIGTCRPAVEAVGDEQGQATTELIAAIGESVLRDLRTAAQLAGAAEAG